ncbi:bis(5'-nucleosyl)-tetraphosphatase (symmetrical) YqeK [Leptospira bandrabouensis]|uniref:bis(5'-nucleosyl)-tetraphosphatase (symmetrical) YqeK n=1 Tax=Leptospira bandrabouensis TaxID=2484903 RepID=UPI001EE7DB60|nr:bis(5'-nucleosyl)-tetraphosphatase (symmetrical) YqeK [Leptospira bandrabouensis]MCG6144690.1 bis(5'-nucleosyl)-tetraphosphatase (symmetrical) YqeK [Leptospira bandrabouensis]MCG6161678.1 bis(5'-nucleosyl)-tetraphosphatase (symmetrical) YqeK [Leptospira bandrabouensis]MCG6164605.1 bis(5'-nucleosyl)-tetraphosphatase (symmetrical) YqeK [Leptospira bandrabouensis]MCW7459400.1 bis(5'-nucleosyl)-tetraphosphatase (symmetrical) YqeK [Leptospira bandrabouensis]MCW7477933.1 bis(5'-nucleosyl)-tetraph
MIQIPEFHASIENWILFFKEEVPKHVTETRYHHILRVADYAEDLAKIHGYPNPKKAYLAGLCHDITKQKKQEIHLGLFREFFFDETGIPVQALHAYSAPFWLKKEYGFSDPEVAKAISSHTLGNESPSLLDRIVYASDFLGSDFAFRNPELSLWVSKTKENLSYGVFMKAFQTISFLMEKKEVIHPNTFHMYNQSANQIKENQFDVT